MRRHGGKAPPQQRQSARSREGYQVVREMLVKAREDKEISQSELARRIDKPHGYVSKIELNRRRIDPAELVLILEALDVDPSDFMKKLQRNLTRPRKPSDPTKIRNVKGVARGSKSS